MVVSFAGNGYCGEMCVQRPWLIVGILVHLLRWTFGSVFCRGVSGVVVLIRMERILQTWMCVLVLTEGFC